MSVKCEKRAAKEMMKWMTECSKPTLKFYRRRRREKNMTIAELKQYRSICAEIRDIESDLEGSYAGDTVQSGSRFPYSKHTVRIEGYIPCDSTTATLARLSELKHQKTEIEEFVEGISDNEIKMIISWRYIKCKKPLSWQAIAMRLGFQAEHTPKRKLQKYFQNVGNVGF